jgi:hypothetical protein
MNEDGAPLISGKVAKLWRTIKKGNFASDDKIALLSFCS